MFYFRSSIFCILLGSAAWVAAAEPGADLMTGPGVAVSSYDMDALLEEGKATAQLKALKRPERMRELTEEIYATRVVAEEARALGLADDPLVKAQLRRLEDRFLVSQRIIQLNQEPVPDFSLAAKDYYQAHHDEFVEGEAVTASHILIMIRDRRKQVRTRDEAKEIAEKVHREALEGADFEALALEYSDDPSVQRNRGDLGRFGRGTMVKPFEDAVFAMREPGQISDVVESDFGFHIIQLHSYEPGVQRPYEEVKADIVRRLESEYRADRRAELLEAAKAKGDPKIDDEALSQYIQQRLSRLPEADKQSASPTD